MPELPDVEVFRRDLERDGLEQRIERAHVLERRVLEDVSPQRLRDALRGRRLVRTRRHGKWLFAATDGAPWLVLHFGMTGFVASYPADEEQPRHARLVLDLEGGRRLAWVCQRLFGRVGLTRDPDAFVAARRLGPDALALDEAAFLELLAGRKGGVKALLMDQEALAGVGNVYSDEALFQAHVHPALRVEELDGASRRRLYRSLRRVLDAAIARRAQPDRMPRTWLTPHRGDEACPRCGSPLRRQKVAGRSAWLCEGCQARRAA